MLCTIYIRGAWNFVSNPEIFTTAEAIECEDLAVKQD